MKSIRFPARSTTAASDREEASAGGDASVGVGAVVSGVELVLEPAEGGLVGTDGRFDGGPGDAVVQKSLDGEHLATQLTF